MDIVAMIKHYRTVFETPKDILEWIEHDLKHMGLSELELEDHLNQAKRLLGTRS